jgi:hypothetical protein
MEDVLHHVKLADVQHVKDAKTHVVDALQVSAVTMIILKTILSNWQEDWRHKTVV